MNSIPPFLAICLSALGLLLPCRAQDVASSTQVEQPSSTPVRIESSQVVSVKPEQRLIVLNAGQRSGLKVGTALRIYRHDRPTASAVVVDVSGNPADAEPAGHYLVTLELGGKQPRINVKIQGKTVKCVKSTDPQLEGMEGEIGTFRTQGRVLPGVESGGYMVRMRNAKHAMSQIWIFRKDGRAAVREIPDRGEMQSAVPVKDDTLEPPK